MLHLRIRLPRLRLPSKNNLALILALGFCFAFIGVMIFLKFGKGASANWYDDNWLFRTAVDFGNTGGSNTQKKVKVEVDTASLITAGKMKADCSDSRFTDINGNPLSFYQGYNLGSTANMRHESNNFSEYTSSNTDSGDLSTSAAAAMGGSSYGMAALIDDTNNIYASKALAFTSPTIRYRFYFDPNSITMVTNDVFYLGGLYVSGSNYVNTHLRWNGSTFQLRAAIDNDAGTSTNGTYFNITDAPHYIEIEVNRATTVSSNDATLEFYIDGSLQETLTGIDFYDQYNALSNSRWGAVSSIDAGTSGTIYLDELAISDNGSTIGPIADGCNNASTDYYVLIPSIISGSNAIYHYYGNTNPTANTVALQFNQDTFSPTSGPSVGSEQAGPGPMASWAFDEGYGTNTNDSTANNNDGTITNAVWKNESDCISGKCLYFDGTGDYVTMGDMYSDALTVCTWIKPLQIDAADSILIKRNNASNAATTNEWSLTLNANKTVNWTAWNSGGSSFSINSTQTVTLNQWSHVCAVQGGNGNTGYVYINSIPTAGATQSITTVNSTSIVQIGSWTAGTVSRYFTGFVDEATIYPYARSADQIKQDFTARGSVHGIAAQFGNDPERTGESLSNGLVGYWKMDETSSPSLDSSGVGSTGAWGNNTTSGVGKYGNSAVFDGTDDYITIPDNDNFSLSNTNQLTVATWVKFNALGSRQTIISKGSGSNYEWDIRLESDNTLSGIVFTSAGGTYMGGSTTATVTAGPWYHVVMVLDTSETTGPKLFFYLNGQLATTYSATSGSYTNGTAALRFGERADGVEDFKGSIDEARIYNRALNSTEIRGLYNFAAEPLAYWKFDENTGLSTYNTVGTGSSATLVSMEANEWQPGKYGSALQFGESGEYVNAGDINDPTSQITLSAWVKWRAVSDYDGIISKRTPTENDGNWVLRMQDNSSGKLQWMIWETSASQEVLSTSTIPTGTWTHVALTFDEDTNTTKMYINGKLDKVDTSTITKNLANTADSLLIGHDGQGSSEFDGLIDDVKIYNYVRTDGQIIEDINAGHPLGSSPAGSQARYYKFDEGYGTSANDSSINLSAGTLASGTAAPTWTNAGKFGKALSFDGTLDNVSISAVTLDETFTISHWIKTTSSASQMYTIGNASSGDGYRFGLHGGKIGFLVGDSGGNTESTCGTITVNDNQWHYIAGVYDNTQTKFTCYIDGKLAGTVTTTDFADMQSTATPGIGNPPCCTDFVGSLDELKVYTAALTQEQIYVDYNQGKAVVFGSTSTTSDGTTSDNSASREYCIPGDTTTCSDPILHFSFDQNSGTSTVNDISTSSNNASMNGSMTESDWVPGKMGSALDFDGANDYLSIASGINLANSSFSFGFWTKRRTASADDIDIFSQGNTTTDLGLHVGYRASNNLFIFGFRNDDLATTATYTDTNWHYWAGTYNASTNDRRLYLDGVLVANDTATGDYAGSGAFEIGRRNFGSGSPFYYDGLIDDLKLFTYTRTPAQIAWEYNKGAPLVHYKLDECQGTTAYNSALNANGVALGYNGTITIGGSGTNTSAGTCVGTSSHAWKNGATGKVNSALYFDGVDDYLTAGTFPALNGASQLSVAGWLKRGAVGTTMSISKEKTDGTDIIFIEPYSDGKVYFGFANGSYADGEITLADAEWHHYVLVFDGSLAAASRVKAYIDGKYRPFEGVTGTFPTTSAANSTTAFYIGREGDWTSYSNGYADDVRFYNYALTPVQVKTIYNNGAVSFK